MSYLPLNAQALRYLQQLQQRLNASGSERVKTSTKTVQQVLAWCVEHELELVPGNSLQLPQFTFSLALPYQQALIIYRGDQLYSQGCKALKAAWLKQNKPAIYFGDFDAKGVSIALNEGYSAMLLPDFATLQQHASQSMQPDKQLSFIAGIKAKMVTSEFQPYQQLLCQQLKGLRQQNMQNLMLKPISVHCFSESY